MLMSIALVTGVTLLTRNSSFKYTLFAFFFFSIATDCMCRLKQAFPMYVSMCTNSRAIYLCMNIGLSSARACFRERANHFSRAMAPKSGAVHAPIRVYASGELREARRCTRRTAPRQIDVVRWCVRFNTNDKGKIRLR